MDDDHPTGEVRPVIVRDVLDTTETQGESVGMRFCAASATGFVPPEPCHSLRKGGSSASGAGNGGSRLRTHGDRISAKLGQLEHRIREEVYVEDGDPCYVAHRVLSRRALAQDEPGPKFIIETPEGPVELEFEPAPVAIGGPEETLESGYTLDIIEPALAPERKKHTFKLGSTDIPEIKVAWEVRCRRIVGTRICGKVPITYKRTSSLSLYGDIILPANVNQRVEGALRGCAWVR